MLTNHRRICKRSAVKDCTNALYMCNMKQSSTFTYSISDTRAEKNVEETNLWPPPLGILNQMKRIIRFISECHPGVKITYLLVI